MYFPLGILSLCVCAFLFILAVLGTRSPRRPVWAADIIMASIITPLIVALLALGVAGVIQSCFPGNHPSPGQLASAALMVAVSLVVYYLLGINKKLMKLRQGSVGAEIISFKDLEAKSRGRNGITAEKPEMPKAA